MEETNKTLTKKTLMATSILLLILGTVGGPLVARLYFLHGGSRIWLPSLLETAGFPLLLLPLSILHLRDPHLSITLPILLASSALGVLVGIVDFLYAFGLSFLPVSTSALLNSSQLSFVSIFSYLIVHQRFTPYRVNAVAMLTMGAVVLGMKAGGDRPEGESERKYVMGFVLSLGAAALYAAVMPMVELVYRKAGKKVSYRLVMEMQVVIGASATAVCLVGMIVSRDFQAIPKEAMDYKLGEANYYAVLIISAILWQCYFLGAVGVIFCVHTLLTGVIVSVCIPITGILAVLFYHEKFSSDKCVALALSMWGMASYSYGEYAESKKRNNEHDEVQNETV